MTEQARDLQSDDDAADPAHETGYHRVWDQSYVLAHFRYAEHYLQQAGENDGGEYQRRVAAERREYAGEHHDHRAGGSGHLGAGAAEQRGEEADDDRSPDAGNRSGAGGFTECQRERQRDDAGGHAAEQVSAQVRCVKKLHDKSPLV